MKLLYFVGGFSHCFCRRAYLIGHASFWFKDRELNSHCLIERTPSPLLNAALSLSAAHYYFLKFEFMAALWIHLLMMAYYLWEGAV